MERARTEWLRSLGFEQTTLMHEHDVVFVVRSLAVEYLRPAVFNDALEITVTLTGRAAACWKFHKPCAAANACSSAAT